MACLNLTPGDFMVGNNWLSGPTDFTTANGTHLEIRTNGPNPGLFVSRNGDNENFPAGAGDQMHYIRFGASNNYILVMKVQSGGNRFVTLIDSASSNGLNSEQILFVNLPSNLPLPFVTVSQGSGDLFYIQSPTNGGQINNIQICRSDTGDTLCTAVPYTPNNLGGARITATHLEIFDGGTIKSTCNLPQGDCDVSPSTQNFPDAVLGAGVDPSLSSHIEQFTIENDGDNCLTINSITNVAPYTVVGASFPIELDAGESINIDVQFAPPAIGNYNNVELPIVPAPPQGDTFLRCSGEAREADLSISYSGTVNFGTLPVGTNDSRNLVITNNGEADVTINFPASPGGLDYSWGANNSTISPGGNVTIPITYSPSSEGNNCYNHSFTSNANGSPHNVSFCGTGCVANAEMNVITPPGAFIDFGEVQRQFRTIRIIRVQNPADGPLNFRASVTGPNADLFGIQPESGSITNPVSNQLFTVNPVSPCGALSTGSGEVVFAVTFYGNDVPGTYNATLVINNHNATNVAQPELTYDLQAEIIPLINVDAELVIDRSGSMGENSGDRRKIDTAVDAGKLFIELARPDVEDRVGVVRFNDTPEVVTGLSIDFITAANQSGKANTLNQATTLLPDGGTAVAGGVIVAIDDIDTHPRAVAPPALNTAVVVLTDGHDNTPYLNPADNVEYSLLGENGTTPLPIPPDKKIYAVGIGDNIDNGRLSELASGTGGNYLHVQNFSGLDYFKLEKHFTQIYMDLVDLSGAVDPTYLIDPGEKHTQVLDVLSGDTSFMVVVFDRDGIRIPFYAESPQGEVIDLFGAPPGFQIRPGISPTARFLEVKLPVGEPERYSGQWKIIVEHQGEACYYGYQTHSLTHLDKFSSTRKCKSYDDPIMYGIAIGVGSNFRMQPYVNPGIVKVGEAINLNALITEYTLPVTGCTVTVEAKAPDGAISHHTLFDDGNHNDEDANDGNYGKAFMQTHVSGMYEFTFRASGLNRDGEKVNREAVRTKFVEGNVPLIPERPVGTGKGDDCCDNLIKWLRLVFIGIILVVLLLIYQSFR